MENDTNAPDVGNKDGLAGGAKEERDDLERTEELFDFLQGVKPDGYIIPDGEMPKLTREQAWTVIWYLGNQYWQVPDHIERCEVCGWLYDSEAGGECLDYGNAPYNFCDNCIHTDEYVAKAETEPANMD